MTEEQIDLSIQTRPEASQPVTNVLSGWLQVMTDSDEAPPYWSRVRDAWLRDFIVTPGNDLLAGTISTVVAKVCSTGWYLEGPERSANLYRKILIEQSDFGGGWDSLLSKSVADYLTQDAGGWIERIREGEEGTAIGLAALDNAQVWISGDPTYPAAYTTSFQADADPEKRDWQKLHRSQLIHLVDMPSPRERLLGVGFCAVSRALTTARVLMDIARYEREKLSDLPPAGMLLLNNMSQSQWGDLQKSYDTRQTQRGNEIWRQVMVAFGLDPSVPLTAELVSFSQLPEAFDKMTTTEIAIYSFAMAFRIDPREIWPVSSGNLGTATETEIMHLKARAKGAGLILTQLERAFNDGLTLPASLEFHFDFQDTEEDQQSAVIANEKAKFIRSLWEPSAVGTGLISTEEARAWLVREGLFDEEELMVLDEEGRAEDVEEAKSRYHIDLGPKVRAFSDGRTIRLKAPSRIWHVPDLALKSAAMNYAAGRIDADTLAEFAIGAAVDGRIVKYNPYHGEDGRFSSGSGGGGGGDGDDGDGGGGSEGEGQESELNDASGHRAAWATPATTYMDEGRTCPPELYDGLESRIGGTIRVSAHKDGTYTVQHEINRTRAPLVTNGNRSTAIDQCQRAYGRILNNEPGDLIGQHRKLVKEALKNGKPVPKEVLALYPDLKH